MVHTHIHEHVADEAVAVGRAVVEDLAHHWVVEVVGRGVGDGLRHEPRIPQHVGVGRVDVAVDGVFHFGAELTGREKRGRKNGVRSALKMNKENKHSTRDNKVTSKSQFAALVRQDILDDKPKTRPMTVCLCKVYKRLRNRSGKLKKTTTEISTFFK